MAGSVPEIEAIKDRETLEAYLRTRPVVESQILALRCALRVMPFVGKYPSNDQRRKQIVFLSVFRMVLFCFSAKAFPGNEAVFASAASAAATGEVESEFEAYPPVHVAISAAAASVSSFASDTLSSAHATAFVSAANAVEFGISAITAVSNVSLPALNAAVVVVTGTAGDLSSSANPVEFIWTIARDDLTCMFNAPSVVCLGMPLWRERPKPEFVDRWEQGFRSALGEFGPDWQVVKAFYWNLRDGQSPFAHLGNKAEEVLLTLAEEERDFWEREPDEVMRDLAERLGERGEPPVTDGEIDKVLENLTQVSADFRFGENEKGAIDAVPFSALARDPGFAGTTLSEAREKAQELADRLKRANAPGRVVRSVTRLLDALPEQLGDLNPALLRSRSRSLEADAVAYGAAGAEAELFPDAVSELLDVVGTLNDLQGCFPAIAEVERNIAAIDIAGREDKVLPELSVISASARELSAQYPHVMTEAAAEAVAALDTDIADAVDLQVKRDLLARSLLIKRNFLSAVYRKVLSPAGREALRVGKLHYDGAISGSVEGVKRLAAFVPTALLIMYLTGPVGAKMSILAEQFKILKDAKYIVDRLIFDRQKSDNGQD